MKLQNNVFFNQNFTAAFQRLLSFEFDSTVTVRIIKSVKILDEQQYAVMLTRDKLLKTYTAINEDGTIKYNNGIVMFPTTENRKKFEEQFNELIRDEFEIPLQEKIKLTKVHKINGNFLEALDNIVEVIDDGGN